MLAPSARDVVQALGDAVEVAAVELVGVSGPRPITGVSQSHGMAQSGSARPAAAADRANRSGKIW